MDSHTDYWEYRGRQGYIYRGERHYTTLPISYSVDRRRHLYRNLDAVLNGLPVSATVLDFGCGDGSHTLHFARKYPHLSFSGTDISSSFVERAGETAREAGVDIRYRHTDGPIPFDHKFDLATVLGVLTVVVRPEHVTRIASDLFMRLRNGGTLALFEATAVGQPLLGRLYEKIQPRRYRGTWVKRTPAYYRDTFGAAGFELQDEVFVSHPFYNYIGRYILYGLPMVFFGGDHIRANANRAYQAIGDAIMAVGRKADPFLSCCEGYTFFVFRKPR